MELVASTTIERECSTQARRPGGLAFQQKLTSRVLGDRPGFAQAAFDDPYKLLVIELEPDAVEEARSDQALGLLEA